LRAGKEATGSTVNAPGDQRLATMQERRRTGDACHGKTSGKRLRGRIVELRTGIDDSPEGSASGDQYVAGLQQRKTMREASHAHAARGCKRSSSGIVELRGAKTDDAVPAPGDKDLAIRQQCRR